MKSKTVNLYTFDELSDKAKEQARDWYRDGGLDYEWWDCTLDDFHTIATNLGYRVDTAKHGKGRAIYFSGFSSQGDGACFAGTWQAANYSRSKMVEYLGDLTRHPDRELCRIVEALGELAKEHPTLTGTIRHTGRYSHSHSVSVDCEEWIETEEDQEDRCTTETEEWFTELSRDLMDWLYRTLERDYDYLNSNESVDESIRANEYTFTADGTRED